MNKENYLEAIKERLTGLPQEDIDRWLEYYSEMIDDRLEDGMTEEQATEAIGSADEISDQILIETPLPTLIKARKRRSRSPGAWEIALLILGFPLWFSLLAAAAAVVLAIYITIWAVIISLYAADLAIAISAVATVLSCIILIINGTPLVALMMLGAGLILSGLSVLLFFAFNQITRGAIKLGALILRGIKRLFIGK